MKLIKNWLMLHIGVDKEMTDEGKIKCKLCNYKGHKPMMRKHLYMAHDITIEDNNET